MNKLNGRTLYPDGDSIVSKEYLYEHVLDGGSVADVCLDEEDYNSEEIKTYNRKYPLDRARIKTSVKPLSTEWNIPEEYKNLNIKQHVMKCLERELKERPLSTEKIKKRIYRTKMELRIWKERGLDDLLRTLVYIVSTFEENDIVWGTGRGSSCASYVLYLIGIHQVDSVRYGLDVGEFFR
jgi:DNA polymerase III alpha subunit